MALLLPFELLVETTAIGSLPRRCRPQVTRTGSHSALHSQSATRRRLNRSLTSSRQFRLPSTGLARALDLGNAKFLGYDFAVLWDRRVAVSLRCTLDKFVLEAPLHVGYLGVWRSARHLVQAKINPLSLFWQSLRSLKSPHTSGTCAAAPAP